MYIHKYLIYVIVFLGSQLSNSVLDEKPFVGHNFKHRYVNIKFIGKTIIFYKTVQIMFILI